MKGRRRKLTFEERVTWKENTKKEILRILDGGAWRFREDIVRELLVDEGRSVDQKRSLTIAAIRGLVGEGIIESKGGKVRLKRVKE
ncbi:MAG: hypothetical protein ACXABV_10050 [Candidatus Thorarchaeota archaeon]|jgi:hypothetical protein